VTGQDYAAIAVCVAAALAMIARLTLPRGFFSRSRPQVTTEALVRRTRERRAAAKIEE
jgi:hypothetical protein